GSRRAGYKTGAPPRPGPVSSRTVRERIQAINDPSCEGRHLPLKPGSQQAVSAAKQASGLLQHAMSETPPKRLKSSSCQTSDVSSNSETKRIASVPLARWLKSTH